MFTGVEAMSDQEFKCLEAQVNVEIQKALPVTVLIYKENDPELKNVCMKCTFIFFLACSIKLYLTIDLQYIKSNNLSENAVSTSSRKADGLGHKLGKRNIY